MDKVGALFVGVILLVPFGLGLAAAFGLGSMFLDEWRRKDWVETPARVDPAVGGVYTYTFGGKSYQGSQVAFEIWGERKSLSTWRREINAAFAEARRTGGTIPVYVNPENPSQAIVMRKVPRFNAFFMGSIAVVFGGVGLLGLASVIPILIRKNGETP